MFHSSAHAREPMRVRMYCTWSSMRLVGNKYGRPARAHVSYAVCSYDPVVGSVTWRALILDDIHKPTHSAVQKCMHRTMLNCWQAMHMT